MIKKKICLIGAYAVGKTSLVRRYVSGIFSDDYLTTVGVKIDQRTEQVADEEVRLMIWDIAGRDEFQKVEKSYLKGSAGFIYVIDGTRAETLDAAIEEMAEIQSLNGGTYSIVFVNKSDLKSEWELSESSFDGLRDQGVDVHFTSAKTGENVEASFLHIAKRLISEEAVESD